MDDLTTSRRRLLEGASVGGAALLAGCTDQLDLGGDAGTHEHTESGGTTVDGVGAIATIDREALQQEQLQIREELQSGNITQEEARNQAAELRDEYVSEAIDALTETIESTDGVTVDEEYRSLGAVIVTGEAAPILGVLDSEDVSALVSRADVEEQAETAQTTAA